jgi:Tol biopolymer transport system component
MRLIAFLVAVLYVQGAFCQASNPRFSFDERSMAFQLCDPKCRVIIRSINDDRSSALDHSNQAVSLTYPSFDPQSERIVFVREMKQSDGYTHSQVVTSRRDGSDLAVLTTSDTFKRAPSFSHDGKKIAFLGNERAPRPDGRRKYIFTDVYEYDLIKNQERRITDLRTVDISAPFYTNDGEHVTFSTVGSARPRANGTAPSIPLEKLYPNKTVFVFPIDGPQKLVPFATPTNSASSPMTLKNGAITFLAGVTEGEGQTKAFGHAVFLLVGSNAKQLTHLRTNILQFAVSPTGHYFAFVRSGRRGFLDSRISIWDANTDEERDIDNAAATTFRIVN